MIDDLINTDTTNMTQDELEAHIRETIDFVFCSFNTYKMHPKYNTNTAQAADDKYITLPIKVLHNTLIPNASKFTWSQESGEKYRTIFSMDNKRMTPILMHNGDKYERAYSVHDKFMYFDPSTLKELTTNDPNAREFLRHIRLFASMRSYSSHIHNTLDSMIHYYMQPATHGFLHENIDDFYSDKPIYDSDRVFTNISLVYNKGKDCSGIRSHDSLVPENRLNSHLLVNIVPGKDHDDTIKISFLGDKTQLRDWWAEIQPGLKENVKEEYFARCLQIVIDTEKRIKDVEDFSKVI